MGLKELFTQPLESEEARNVANQKRLDKDAKKTQGFGAGFKRAVDETAEGVGYEMGKQFSQSLRDALLDPLGKPKPQDVGEQEHVAQKEAIGNSKEQTPETKPTKKGRSNVAEVVRRAVKLLLDIKGKNNSFPQLPANCNLPGEDVIEAEFKDE